MNLIVAVAKDWGIGCENELLFRIPADHKYFRKTTTGKVVVMGHNTFKSLPGGKPLKDRVNIVLSRNPGLAIPGVTVCNCIEDLLVEIKKYNAEDVFVIGGEKIYTALLEYCTKAYVTKIDAVLKSDTFFPNIDEMPEWELVQNPEWNEHDGIRYRFCVYERIGGNENGY